MAILTNLRRKDPQVIRHKIRDKKDQSMYMYIYAFFPSPGHVRYRIK